MSIEPKDKDVLTAYDDGLRICEASKSLDGDPLVAELGLARGESSAHSAVREFTRELLFEPGKLPAEIGGRKPRPLGV